MPLDAYVVLSAPTILPKTAPDIFSVNVNRNLFRPLTAVKSISAGGGAFEWIALKERFLGMRSK
jgi:hypothetical protein